MRSRILCLVLAAMSLSSGLLPASATRQSTCSSTHTGSFQPVQSVWQDDPERHLPAHERLRLLQHSRTRYEAGIPMVANKSTVLFGVDRALDPETRDPIPKRSRAVITIKGTTTCDLQDAVGVRFTVMDNRSSLNTLVPGAGRVPIPGGPAGARRPFRVVVNARASQGVPAETFTIFDPGPYTIRGEAVGKRTATGLAVTVSGQVIATRMPSVHIVPAVASEAAAEKKGLLQRRAARLAREAQTRLPDYFPIVSPQREPFVVLERLELSPSMTGHGDLRDAGGRVEIVRRLATSAQMRGIDRVVVMLTSGDMRRLFPRSSGPQIRATTQNERVVFVDTAADHFTLAHQLVHTLPYPGRNTDSCRVDNERLALAHGVRVTVEGGFRSRTVVRDERSFMERGIPRWIDQCTYGHVAGQLGERPPVATLVVQGRVTASGQERSVEMHPAYQTVARPDPPAADSEWSIVLKDAGGAQLLRHAFPMTMSPPHARKVGTVAFAVTVPEPQGVASIEVVGPGGVLATRAYSSSSPEVGMTAPGENEEVPVELREATISWTGSDLDGDVLTYTLLSSRNQGKTWALEAFETTATSHPIRIRAAEVIRVRLVATDGVRTASAERTFSVSG